MVIRPSLPETLMEAEVAKAFTGRKRDRAATVNTPIVLRFISGNFIVIRIS